MATPSHASFADYLKEVAAYYEAHRLPSQGNIRIGQAYFNCLPDRLVRALAEDEQNKREIDPFYNDNNLAQFLVWVEISWED